MPSSGRFGTSCSRHCQKKTVPIFSFWIFSTNCFDGAYLPTLRRRYLMLYVQNWWGNPFEEIPLGSDHSWSRQTREYDWKQPQLGLGATLLHIELVCCKRCAYLKGYLVNRCISRYICVIIRLYPVLNTLLTMEWVSARYAAYEGYVLLPNWTILLLSKADSITCEMRRWRESSAIPKTSQNEFKRPKSLKQKTGCKYKEREQFGWKN